MRTPIRALLLAAALLAACRDARQPAAALPDRERPLDSGWRFARDAPGVTVDPHAGAEQPGYDDAAWRTVDLPHDWSIEDLPEGADVPTAGPFLRDQTRVAQGYTWGGTGWYRRRFTLDAADAGKAVKVVFDGVSVESDAWVNGVHLGHHPSGYVPVAYDLTPHLGPPGEENVLAVRVTNLGNNSRWYTGSGIYRPVVLLVTDPVHVDLWGVHLRTTALAAGQATVAVTATIANAAGAREEVVVRLRLLDADGAEAARAEGAVALDGAGTTFTGSLEVASPRPWSPASPHLYVLEVTLLRRGQVIDVHRSEVGLRTLAWDPVNGLRLNGGAVKLRGANVHHDHGMLGAASFPAAEARRVRLLQAAGFNAIRTAHNPPSRALLEACDRLGVLVEDEFTDVWNVAKTADDASRHFGAVAAADLSTMLRRDRNHPSVVLWSIGNEIPERFSAAGVETAARLVEVVRDHDLDRPITAALNGATPTSAGATAEVVAAYGLLDVAGYNYNQAAWEADRAADPDALVVSNESVALDAHDVWSLVEAHPWAVGDFVWAGIDYLGEPAVGYAGLASQPFNRLDPWPWFGAGSGALDLVGDEKAAARYRAVVWRERLLELVVHAPIPAGDAEVVKAWAWPDERPSWTWPVAPGTPLEVVAYGRCDAVRFSLDGVGLGEQAVSAEPGLPGLATARPVTSLVARLQVPYAPGKLRAACLVAGAEVAARELATAGAPSGLALTPEAPALAARRDALAFVRVEVVDAGGAVEPNAAAEVALVVEGPGELLAAGNGSSSEVGSYRRPGLRTWRGAGLAVVRATGAQGTIVVKATSPGLAPAAVAIPVEGR